ncbi:hypothetical protein OF829_17005 [Sphingomonas sp. LB-2]|uniref:hypothetical protein n=1 Tax=Sphingomonas caeni TaxID=2984949 RepID=UPI0022319C7A|nr:hypothetical protein [Sphingomonas caeni]MCW3848939.1 hypothetical protein [Sphingomonas caeni]
MAPPRDAIEKRGFLTRIAPALTLAVLAPLIAEVLPGATRFSSLFVFPVEMMVWGGGAVMIRELVRTGNRGWASMLCLALALAIAEEWLIQQTSLASLVVQIKGVEYGRAFGINYVYFLWAAVYEAVLVVFVPVMLTEMLFPARRHARWLNKAGWAVHLTLFAFGSFFAWFSWTQIARTQVFHLPAYTPPLTYVLIAAAAIAALIAAALSLRPAAPKPLAPPAPILLALGGAVWAVLWFGLEVIAFGAMPALPPAAAVGPALLLCAAMVTTLPGWSAHPAWSDRHRAWLIAGTMIATMAVFFYAGFEPGTPDFWFKAVTNAVAAILFALLVSRAAAQPRS